jgi:hypothetical protein
MWEVGLPPSPVEFSSHSRFYKLSFSWLLVVCHHSCLLWLTCLFTVPWRIAPPPLRCSGCPPSLLCGFFVVIAYYCFFFFFPWVGVSLSRGLCWSGPGLSVGVPHAASSPCGLRLPKPSGCCRLVAREPFWFLCLTWSRDSVHRLGVWRSQSFASSQWFFL